VTNATLTTGPISAPQLYARALGMECSGSHECHWCYSPCGDRVYHDDPPPLPFARSRGGARNPLGRFVCAGCHEFRKTRQTVRSLRGQIKDGQSPRDHSWLVRDTARAVFLNHAGERQHLYQFLLEPRAPFALALCEQGPNHLHLARVNQPAKLNDRTELEFTLDNVVHRYSVYELCLGLENGPDGREPGVRAIVNLLGPCDAVPRLEEPKKVRVKRVKLPELVRPDDIVKAEILPDHPDDLPEEDAPVKDAG
jgi:hypothetical protein